MYYLSLSIYTYGDTGITELDSATGSIYLGDPEVDGHHRNIQNTHSIVHSSWTHALLPSFHWSTHFVWFFTHCCPVFIDPHNICRSSRPGIPSYPLTHFLHSSNKKSSFARIPFRCHAGCGGVLIKGWLPSSSTISPYCDRVNLGIHSQAVIVQVWRPWSCELGRHNHQCWQIHSEAAIERVWRCTWWL